MLRNSGAGADIVEQFIRQFSPLTPNENPRIVALELKSGPKW